jgi:cytochrome c oxidase assembly protein subunit 15
LRHKALGAGPHLIGAAVAGFLVGCVCYRAVTELGARDGVRKLARWVGGILALQLILGVASYMLRGSAQESAQPVPSFILLTTAHVAVGALLLGSSLMLTLLAYRRLAVSGKVSSLAGSPQRTLA